MGLLPGAGAYHAEQRGISGRDMWVLINHSTSASSLSASSSQSIISSAVGISSVFREGGISDKEGSGDESRGLVIIRGVCNKFGGRVSFITASLYDGLDRAIAN